MQLEEAVRLKRSDASFHRLLGEAYYQQGMKWLAALELTSALKPRPISPKPAPTAEDAPPEMKWMRQPPVPLLSHTAP
jgi:hypothetical protein